MTLYELLQTVGINPEVLVAGGFGGALRALSRKQLKVRDVILSPICGSLAAAYLTLPTVHYIQAVGWPIPKDEAQVVLATAFLVGTCAMWISDLLFEAIARRLKTRLAS